MRDHREFYRQQIGRPEHWQFSGENLIATATVVWQHFAESNAVPSPPTWEGLEREMRLTRLIPPFKLLVGLAFENFLKGLYVAKTFGVRPERLLDDGPLPTINEIGDFVANASKAFVSRIVPEWFRRSAVAGPSTLPDEIVTHDLVALAEAAGVTLSQPERKLLLQLTDYVEFAGRYPAPRKARPFPKGQLLADRDYEDIRDLVERLRHEYAQLGFTPMHLEKGEAFDRDLKTAAAVQARWKADA